MTTIRIPWRAWYGDDWLELSFPPSWYVRAYWPADASDIGPMGIERALDAPIDAPPIEEMVRGKRWVSIAVDDISRPAPAARIMPSLMRRLERAGVDLDRVRVVLGTGTHRPMVKEDIIKKIGRAAADRLDVYNNHPYDNVVDLGSSDRGTPVHVCRFFAEADLKIGVGSITPHGNPGFGGGAKVVIPGVAGIDTIASIHQPSRLQSALIEVEHNEFRTEIEHIARDKVGLDYIINVVTNSHREIAGLFVGDMVSAHRAGVRLARQVYATEMPAEPVDIAICNAYPKDTDFLQSGMALNVLRSSPRPVVKEGGMIVIITASPEGRGYHGLFGPGMRYDLRCGDTERRASPTPWDARIVYFSPWLTSADVGGDAVFRRWDDLIEHLAARYGDEVIVAVFPCGSIQLARETVLA